MMRSSNRGTRWSRLRTLLIATAAVLLLASGACSNRSYTTATTTQSTVVYLLRHAEVVSPYTEDRANPPLNAAGEARAQQLVDVLRDAGITRIFSTKYTRTEATVTPLAEHLSLSVESYELEALTELAEFLRSTPGRFVVSGHGHTTPELVGLLGGDPEEEFDDFDRLYIVILSPGGNVTSMLIRYGSVRVPPAAHI